MLSVASHRDRFVEIMGNVAADWFELQDDITLIFGDEFKARGAENLEDMLDLAKTIRDSSSPDGMQHIQDLVLTFAGLAEGYAASLKPLYNLPPGTPNVADLINLGLQESAAEIVRITQLGASVDSALRGFCP